MGKFKVGDRVVLEGEFSGYPDGAELCIVDIDGVGDPIIDGSRYGCSSRDHWPTHVLDKRSSTQSTPDNVNSPSHYQSSSGIECIEAIRAQLTADEFRGYIKGNIAKYVWRERTKGGDESLRKAKWYLDKLIEALAKNTAV